MTYTAADVRKAGNDPEVAFPESAMFKFGMVPLDPSTIATIESYREQGDHASADRIEAMAKLYKKWGPGALPLVVANREGYVEDGAHRMAAALRAGFKKLPAYVEVER